MVQNKRDRIAIRREAAFIKAIELTHSGILCQGYGAGRALTALWFRVRSQGQYYTGLSWVYTSPVPLSTPKFCPSEPAPNTIFQGGSGPESAHHRGLSLFPRGASVEVE